MSPRNLGLSSVVRKMFMALSGLLLVGFLFVHLAGNISLYFKDGSYFNSYVHHLQGFGRALIVAELILAALFLFHIVWGIVLSLQNRFAKGIRPSLLVPKEANTPSNLSSRNMTFTGLLLLVFIIGHVYSLRFGPAESLGYTTTVAGEQARDLYRLVMEKFHIIDYVVVYVGFMVILGLHLRHAFWSAFQSLGLAFPRYSRAIMLLGYFIAGLLMIGFLFIPLAVYFGFQV